jgi:dTDP-glucose pyrophosphorylase
VSDTRIDELPRSAVLSAGAPLHAAAELVGKGQYPLLLVEDARGPRALREWSVREAWEDRRDPQLAVGALAEPDLVAGDEAAARALLAADAQRPAVLIAGGGRAPRIVQRTFAPITVAIVMAGGIGTRLRPLTEDTPKPLLEVGGEALIDRILRLLASHGVQRVFVSVNYLRELVKAHVGDGARFGVRAVYLEEDEPLDTGAGLALIPRSGEPFFVVNGDVLTNANLTAMARAHQIGGAIATVATHLYPMPLPYGHVHAAGAALQRIEEKPVLRYSINAGIYAIAPQALDHVAPGKRLAMVPFLNERVAAGQKVCRFPLVEYWNDVGQPHDYMRAQKEVRRL